MSESSGGSIASRLAKNGAALAVGGVVAQVAVILVEVVMARGLGATAYGIFATTYAFTILAIFLFDCGTTWWTIQEGSRKLEQLPALLGNSILFKTTAFCILYALVIGIVYSTTLPIEIKTFVAVFGFYGLGLALVDTLAAVYTAKQQMHVNAVFQALSPVAILLIYLIAALDGVSLMDAAIAYVVGSGAVGLIWLLWTSRKLKPVAKIRDSVSLAAKSYHYGLTGILRQIFYKTDVVMIAFISGAAEAGVYAAAVKFLDLFYKIPVLASRVVSPALFAESHGQTSSKFELLVSGYSRFLVSVGAVAALVTFISADELVMLVFGEQYAASSSVLKILSLAMILKCMMTVGEGVLSSLDKHTERWVSLGIAVLLNIVANLILIPRLGGEGAAIATLVSGSLLIILYIFGGFGAERVRSAGVWFGVPLLLTVLVGAVFHLAGLGVLLSVPLAVVAFVLMLFLTRVMSIGELRTIVDSLMSGGEKR